MRKGPRRVDILMPLDKIWKLHLQGVTTAALSERTGLSTRAISGVIQKRREAEEAARREAAS